MSSSIMPLIENLLGGKGTYHRTSRGVQYSYNCPFCGDTRERLFINPARQVYYCHNESDGGTLVTLISLLTGKTWQDALTTFRKYEGFEIELPEELEQEIYAKLNTVNLKVDKVVHPLPEEFKLVEEADDDVGRQVTNYLFSRGITMNMCRKYYIGYCSTGRYHHRVIMPDFEDGELIYWQGRTILPTPTSKEEKKKFRKVLNPKLSDDQIDSGCMEVGKSEIISNIDLIKESGIAVLCEGKMDSYTIGNSGGCLHGKYLSDTQLMKLVRNKDKIHTIFVMMDGDAFEYTLKIAKRLYRYFDDIYICKLPTVKDDPNSLGRKKCLEIIQNAIKYDNMFEVRCKLGGV